MLSGEPQKWLSWILCLSYKCFVIQGFPELGYYRVFPCLQYHSQVFLLFFLSVKIQWFDSMLLGIGFGMVLTHAKNFLKRAEKGRMEFWWHWCSQRHCFCLLQEQFHWHRLSTPEVPHFRISGCWLLGSRGRSWRWNARSSFEEAGFLYQYGALELSSTFSGEPPLPVEHGEKYSWQPMLLGRWMIVFCSLLPCSWGSWLHFQI